jgi:hypothetical protein
LINFDHQYPIRHKPNGSPMVPAPGEDSLNIIASW